jgi:hypothetical protein
MSYFLIGGAIGLVSAFIGALVDYLISRRRQIRETNGPPGCLILVTGGLGLTGVAVTVLSWFLTGSIWLAVITGFGVFSGFFVGFATLFIGSVLLNGRNQ